MRLYYLLLSVHRPGRGQMRGLRPFRWRRGRSPFAGDRVDDIDATIFVGESDGRLTSGTRGILERCMRIRRVNVLVEIVHSVVLLHPIGDVGLPVVGHGRRRISKTQDLVRRRGRVEFALLRDLPFLSHDALEILQKVAGRCLVRGS